MKWLVTASLLLGASLGSSTAFGFEIHKASLVRASIIGDEVALNVEGVLPDLCSILELEKYHPFSVQGEGSEIYVHLTTVSEAGNCAQGTNPVAKRVNLGLIPNGTYTINIFTDGVLSHSRLYMVPNDIDPLNHYEDFFAPDIGFSIGN